MCTHCNYDQITLNTNRVKLGFYLLEKYHKIIICSKARKSDTDQTSQEGVASVKFHNTPKNTFKYGAIQLYWTGLSTIAGFPSELFLRMLQHDWTHQPLVRTPSSHFKDLPEKRLYMNKKKRLIPNEWHSKITDKKLGKKEYQV